MQLPQLHWSILHSRSSIYYLVNREHPKTLQPSNQNPSILNSQVVYSEGWSKLMIQGLNPAKLPSFDLQASKLPLQVDPINYNLPGHPEGLLLIAP